MCCMKFVKRTSTNEAQMSSTRQVLIGYQVFFAKKTKKIQSIELWPKFENATMLSVVEVRKAVKDGGTVCVSC